MNELNLKKQLVLEGLSCANCAAKIEHNVKGLEGINDAYINMANQTFTIEFTNAQDTGAVLNKINTIINTIEPDVVIKEKDSAGKIKPEDMNLAASKPKMVLFFIGTGLFLAGFIFNLPFWAKFCLFAVSYILAGSQILISAGKSILKGEIFDENFLMSIASLGAFCIGEFPEGVAVMIFYRIGEFFQDAAVNNSRRSISKLMDIRPDYANLLKEGDIEKVDPRMVNIGDYIIVKPGEKVPLDGVVINGWSALDTLALTGEGIPRDVISGDEVLSGMINKSGTLTVEVKKSFGESTVSKILEMVENAAGKKAKAENFITKFARYYTPVVVGCAVLLAVFPPLIGAGDFSIWINRALVFLVVSCPCALVLSIPLSFFSGIGGASKNGILVKGGSFLEALNHVDTVVFDKTGTLTEGKFSVTEVKNIGSETKEKILKYAAYAESFSNHPIAVSILNAFEGEVDQNSIQNHEEIAGQGVKIIKDGRQILVGNARLMKKEGIEISGERDIDGTVVHVAEDGNYLGYILISDTIKEDSEQTMGELRELGIKNLVMLSGDNNNTAQKTGKALGLDRVYAELLPDKKVEEFEKLKAETKGKIMYVGDGINDAPVLARSDVGVAMGALGSDAAIEAADIVIMNDKMSRLVTMLKVAKKTKTIVTQNIVFSLLVKAAMLLLGAIGIATMWGAVFADVGVALIAVLNASRAMRGR